MSPYAVNKLARLTLHDLDLRERLTARPEEVVGAFPGLTDQERAALLDGQVGLLHALGAHSFLLGYLARYGLFGLTQAQYAERMRAGRELR